MASLGKPSGIFNINNFWIPLVIPHFGGLLGGALYFGLVEVLFPRVNEVNLKLRSDR